MTIISVQFFDKNRIYVADTRVYKHCGDVCNYVILMSQFFYVVQQHILGMVIVVGNIIQGGSKNWTIFKCVYSCT